MDLLTIAWFGLPGGWEWLIILAVALLVFGRRLPEVGRSLGRSIVEFKKGLQGVEEEIENASAQSGPSESGKPALSSPRTTPTSSSAAAPGDPRRVSTSDPVDGHA